MTDVGWEVGRFWPTTILENGFFLDELSKSRTVWIGRICNFKFEIKNQFWNVSSLIFIPI